MGCMGSCIKKIEAVRFAPFPAKKPLNNLRAVVIGHIVYAIGPKGTMYTTGELAGKVCYCGTSSDYHAVLALKALGVITPEQAKLHGELKRVQDRAFDEFRAVNCNIEALTAGGIKLTKGQKARLEEMRKAINVKRLPYFIPKTEIEKALAKKFD